MLHGQRTHRRGEMIISGWSLVQYGDFISGCAWVILLFMYWERRRRRRRKKDGGEGLYWVFNAVIFPLCGFSYALPEVSGSQCYQWRSQSLFIKTLTFIIDWLWLLYMAGSCISIEKCSGFFVCLFVWGEHKAVAIQRSDSLHLDP